MIIAILAAMLLPALNAARGKARNISCVNQLKQIGTYTLMYQDSYNGYIPDARGRTYLSGSTVDRTNYTPNVLLYKSLIAPDDEVSTSGALPKKFELFKCPSDNKRYGSYETSYYSVWHSALCGGVYRFRLIPQQQNLVIYFDYYNTTYNAGRTFHHDGSYVPSEPHLDLRLPACYVFPNPERQEDGMGREGRDYWEAQLSEYWDSGLTIQEYSELKELPYEVCAQRAPW